MNSLAIQHALYLTGGLLALAGAVMIVAAMRADAPTFGITFWLLLAATVLGLFHAGRVARRSWTSLDDAARLADERARLEDRLATLVAYRKQARRTRLSGVLLSQTMALSKRWDVRTVVPTRLSKSVYFLLVSLIVLAGTTFLERRPAEPVEIVVAETSAVGAAQQPGTSPNKVPLVQERSGAERGLAYSEQGQAHHRGGVGTTSGGSALSAVDREPAGETSSEPDDQDDQMVSAQNGANDTQDASDPLSQRLQELIRQAFGAERMAPPRQLAQTATVRDDAHRKQSANHSQAAQGKPKEDKSATNDRKGKNGEGSEKNADAEKSSEGGGQGGQRASSGKVQSGTQPGLLRAVPAKAGEGAEKARFELKLTGFAPGFQTRMQPQIPSRKAPPSAAEFPIEASADEPAVGEQTGTAEALYKFSVAPEYERIVHRIYSARE